MLGFLMEFCLNRPENRIVTGALAERVHPALQSFMHRITGAQAVGYWCYDSPCRTARAEPHLTSKEGSFHAVPSF